MADDVDKINDLPEPLHTTVITAFSDALGDVFLAAVPCVLVALVVAFFITEVPLKSRPSEAAEEDSAVEPLPSA